MAITFDRERGLFHLQNGEISYVLQVTKEGYLLHRYWGKAVAAFGDSAPLVFFDRAFSPNPTAEDRTFSLDAVPLEYSSFGSGDYRAPAFQAALPDGSTVSDLRFASYRVLPGKPKLDGLPATYAESDGEAQTLELTLRDALSGLAATLCYTVFARGGAIARSVKFTNEGGGDIRLLRALSASVDFGDDGFELLTLDGAHANERNASRRPLAPGLQSVESRRGASSHQHNPFLALLRPGTDEEHGEAYGMSLVYSGNFLAFAEADQFHTARAAIGLNPFDFSWLLRPGESFQCPEAVLAYSCAGLGGLSRAYHRLYRERLCRGRFRDAPRPVLVNSWEAAYFDFDEERILGLAREAKALGLELVVLDDGWFGHRDDDTTSLGDWAADRRKLPGGLESLGRRVAALGLAFGLWFEPEMVSEDSDLFRAHPDWCLHVRGRAPSFGRSQLVLDLSRADVCDFLAESVGGVLQSAPISYVKWDMNRHMTEVGSALLPPERQRETAHRYMLGLYRVLETLTARFPDVLFESCSGGGGRFDPGMLYYMPQTWASDNTDAVCRAKIQYGTSLVYPASAICSHVSVSPNEQIGRVTPLSTRGVVAMSGNFGYELDLTKLSPEEKEEVKKQVALYKELRPLVQFGELHRLLNPFEGNEAAWMFVSEGAAAVFYVKVLTGPAVPVRTLRLRGLDPAARYRDGETGLVFGGDELMNVGLTVPVEHGDFSARLWRFERV